MQLEFKEIGKIDDTYINATITPHIFRIVLGNYVCNLAISSNDIIYVIGRPHDIHDYAKYIREMLIENDLTDEVRDYIFKTVKMRFDHEHFREEDWV